MSEHFAGPRAPLTIADIAVKRERREPIVMITAYDIVSAHIAEAAEVDIVLVGDSGAVTVLGHASTRDVSLDEMLMLTRAVRRGLRTPVLIGDMPFGTYEANDELAVATARRFMDAGCDGVKLEGAGDMVRRVRAIVAAGIPVMGHVGLTPQSTGVAEGFRVQGRTAEAAVQVALDVTALEHAGCFAMVFEAIPAAVSGALMKHTTIPVIGIGAGPATDGQVIVFHDLLGLFQGRTPRFVRRYADLSPVMTDAVRRWVDDVRARRFPAPEHEYGIAADELARLRARLGTEKA